MFTTLAAACLLSGTMIADPPVPAGRPPIGPLERYEPRIWDVTFSATVDSFNDINPVHAQKMRLEDTPIMFPMIFQNTFSVLDPASARPRMLLDNIEDTTLPARARIEHGKALNTSLAVLPVKKFEGHLLRWDVSYHVQVWNSRIDEAAAARITWPREWPEEVQSAIQPQQFIESDDPIFAQAVEDASKGRLRQVPPYIAAKELVRYCLVHLNVSGDGVAHRTDGLPIGFDIGGAKAAAARGSGRRPDVVNVCIATLRAAGIPARAVIGMQRDVTERRGAFVVWGEFYLPDAGWVPFDIDQMRTQNLAALDVHRPWHGFGSLDDLNERVPLAFHYLPPVTSESPMYPSVWGWDPRPHRNETVRQFIRLDMDRSGRSR